MTRDEAIAILKGHEPELKALGVAHAALFGSLARGEADAKSDVDVFVRFDLDVPITLWDYAGLKRRVARMLRRPLRTVDVIDLEGMSATVRKAAERDVLYAF